jgi:putative nucleotidyltransferase with HDIG domain
MDVEKIINDIDTLEPVSHVGNRVMEIISDPDSSVNEVVDVIKYDQAMTANLLKICNSALFGLRREIVSIKQAVAYMGIDKVACLIMVGNHGSNFKNSNQGYDLDEGALWRYSVSSALIAQDLAEKRQLKNVSLLFTSALLKDIGKVVLNTHMRDVFQDIQAKVLNEGLSFIEAEKEVLGIDHAELGGMIAEKWNFSKATVDIIRNHHDPYQSSSDDLSLPIVYLADSICMMIGMGVGADGLAYRYHQDIVDRLNFSDIDLQKTIAEFWEKLKSIEDLVRLSGGN